MELESAEAEDEPGGGKYGWTAVMGFSYWITHFNANPAVIGQTIVVDDIPVRVIGILPRQFTGISLLSPADILLPRHFQAASGRGEDRFTKPNYFEWMVFGRLPLGVTMDAVRANLKTIEPWFRQAADPDNMMFTSSLLSNTAPGSLLNVVDGRFGTQFEFTHLHNPLMGINTLAAFVFVFCCCNLILLFVGRASRESHALAIRMALGSTLGDGIRFAMLEACVLGVAGCVIAVPISWCITRVVSRAFQSIPGLQTFPTISPNGYSLLVATGTTLAVACLSATCAAIWQGRKRASISLKEGQSATTAHSRNWIVGFELCASILLITVAVVSGMGFQKLLQQPSGFGEGSAIMTSLRLKESLSSPADLSKKQTPDGTIDRILTRIENSPGVQSAAMINVLPMSGASTSSTIEVLSPEGDVRRLQIWPAYVSVGYFSSIGTRIVRGRDFVKDDLDGDPVCVLSSRAAATMFPRADPLGFYLYRGSAQSCRIVGIAEDAHFKSMSDPADVIVYQLRKKPLPSIVVRAATSSLAIQAVRDAVRAVDPTALISGIDTIQSSIDRDLRLRRVLTLAGGLCASITAIILGIGFFGILSLQVSERKREIGIQIALGASQTRVCASIARKLRLSLTIGMVFGSGLALLAAEELAKIYGLSLRLMLGGYLGSLFLLGILLATAAAVPLSRALRVSPMECLRSE